MRFRAIMRLGWILSVFLFGCVSTSQFEAVSEDYHLAQQEITDGQKKITDSQKEIDELRYALRNLKEDIDHCRKAQARLEGKIKKSDTEKQLVSEQIEKLKHTINEQATVINKQAGTISIQEAVIRMLDDPQQTIQNSIKEQIETQNLETSALSSPSKSD